MKTVYYFLIVLFLSACSPLKIGFQRLKGRDVLTYMDVNNGKKYHFALTHDKEDFGDLAERPLTQLRPLQKKNGAFWNHISNDSVTLHFYWDTINHHIGLVSIKNKRGEKNDSGVERLELGMYNSEFDVGGRKLDGLMQKIYGPFLDLNNNSHEYYPEQVFTIKNSEGEIQEIPSLLHSVELIRGVQGHNCKDYLLNKIRILNTKDNPRGDSIGVYYQALNDCQYDVGASYYFEYMHNIGPLSLTLYPRWKRYDFFSVNVRLLRINGIRLDKMMGYPAHTPRRLPKNYAFFK